MLGKLLAPLTTATSIGVAIRYLSTIAGSILAILGVLGWLTEDQVTALAQQVPEMLAAIGALIALIVPIYATLTKSSSDKAAAAAKQIDAKLPRGDDVVIMRPGAYPDIRVPAKPGE